MSGKLRWSSLLFLILIFGCMMTACKNKTADRKYNEENPGEIYYEMPSDENIEVNDDGIEYANNEILLVAKENTKKAEIEKLAKRYDAEIIGYIEVTGDYQWKLNQTHTYEELEELVLTLEQESIVESAVIQTVVEVESEDFIRPNDTRWKGKWNKSAPSGENWGIEAIKAPYAWDYIEDMTPVKVGLIDNMFDTEHEDMSFAETFYNLSHEELDDSHGTHVAGIMAANYNNECGITGVYPFGEDNLYAVSTAGASGRTSLFFYKVALAELVVRDVKVINVSLGFMTDGYAMAKGDEAILEIRKREAQELAEFLKKFLDRGYDFVITQAAGNSRGYYFRKTKEEYERLNAYEEDSEQGIAGIANYNHWLSLIEEKKVKDRILVVGAVELKGPLWRRSYEEAYFSDTGSRVDVMAPGVDIWSGSVDAEKYTKKSGTSQAAPHVGGAAATLWSFNSNLTGAEVKEILVKTAQQEVEKTNVKMIDLLAALEATSNQRDEGDPFTDNEGILLGTVHNNKQVIAGAEVLLMESETREVLEKTQTDSQGGFEIFHKKGNYMISINADGYEHLEVDNVHIKNGLVTEISSEDLVLKELVSDIRMTESLIMTIGEVTVIEPEVYFNSLQEFVQNEAHSFLWESSDTNVATIEPTGKAGIIHAKAKGETTITATVTSGEKTITKTTNLRVASKGRDTVLVLDISGSMRGEPMAEMKEAAIDFCKDLLVDEYNNRVGIVFYDDEITTIPLTDDLNSLISDIEQVDDGGLTNMEAGVATAATMLEQQGKSDSIKNIVIMADGLPNDGKTSDSGSMTTTVLASEETISYASAVIDTAQQAGKKFNLYSLGFFHGLGGDSLQFAADLMTKLTNQEDGYHQVEEAENLQFAFGDISEEISDGSKIVINIACPVDVTIKHNGEILSSAAANYNDKTSFGTLQLLGSNRDIKVLTLEPDVVYNVELTGTGEGHMNYSVNYLNEKEELIDSREFIAVPITSKTRITSNTSTEVENMDLNIDEDGDGVIDTIWSAAKDKMGAITYEKEPEPIEEEEVVEVPEIESDSVPKNPSYEIETWKVVLIVIGVLAFAGIAVAVVLICMPKSEQQDEEVEEQHEEERNQEEQPTEDKELVFEPSISILNGSLAGAEIPIRGKDIIYIGKDSKLANIVFSGDYPLISRLHCSVMYDSKYQKYFVTDSSTNGTYYLNGIKLEKGKRTAVEPGTVLVLANDKAKIMLR